MRNSFCLLPSKKKYFKNRVSSLLTAHREFISSFFRLAAVLFMLFVYVWERVIRNSILEKWMACVSMVMQENSFHTKTWNSLYTIWRTDRLPLYTPIYTILFTYTEKQSYAQAHKAEYYIHHITDDMPSNTYKVIWLLIINKKGGRCLQSG